MKELRAELDRAPDDEVLAIDNVPAHPPKAKAKPKPVPIADGFADSDEDPGPPGHGDEPIVVQPLPADPPAAAPAPLPLDGPVVPAAPLAPIRVEAGDEWPSELDGVELLRLAGRDSAGGRYHGRLKVVCPVHGRACHRSRSVVMHVDELGHAAPLFYLGAWLEKATSMDEADHFGWKPRMADMQAYRASHPGLA